MTDLEIEEIHARIARNMAESENLSKKTRWYEVVLIVSCTAALLAAGKHLF